LSNTFNIFSAVFRPLKCKKILIHNEKERNGINKLKLTIIQETRQHDTAMKLTIKPQPNEENNITKEHRKIKIPA
jgi:hypothetical protein